MYLQADAVQYPDGITACVVQPILFVADAQSHGVLAKTTVIIAHSSTQQSCLLETFTLISICSTTVSTTQPIQSMLSSNEDNPLLVRETVTIRANDGH